MEDLEIFIEQLMEAKGFKDLVPEVKAGIKQDLINELLNQVDRAAINALSEEQAKELSAKMDDPNFTDDQVSEYIRNAGLDLRRITLETMQQFRSFYLGEGIESNE